MKNRIGLVVLGLVVSSVWASGCLAVYDWDYQAGSGAGANAGAGGEAGKGGGGIGGAGAGGAGAGGAGTGGAGAGGSGISSSSSSSGSMCPGCTWGRRIGDDSKQIAYHLALANDGSVFLTGQSFGTVDIGGGNVVTSVEMKTGQPFLLKYDRVGQPQWITRPLDGQGLAGNGSQVVVAGNLVAWIGAITNGASDVDTFVEMRNVTGGQNTTLWRKVFGTTMSDSLRSIAVSSDGSRVYLAGAIPNQNLPFNNCPALQPFATPGGDHNLVVLALDAQNGNCLWGKSWGGGHHLNGSISVVTGSDGTPFVSGHIDSGTITNIQGIQIPQVPPKIPNKYIATAFILKIDKNTGNLLAGRGYANGAFVGMTVDPSTGTIVASGGMGGNVTVLGQTITGAPDAMDGADALIIGYDENLKEKWVRNPSGPQNNFCLSVGSDGNGRIYGACSTFGVLDRDVNVNCSTDKACGVLFPIQSSTGAYLGSLTKTFGETQSLSDMGLTFMTAATPTALTVAGSWTAPVRFWDDELLDFTGSFGDFDIAVGKVEPPP